MRWCSPRMSRDECLASWALIAASIGVGVALAMLIEWLCT